VSTAHLLLQSCRRGIAVPLLTLLVSCQSPRQPATAAQDQPAAAPSQPPATSPANVSHGEAPVGNDSTPAPIDPHAPVRSRGRLHQVRLQIAHARLNIDANTTYDGWTFEGRAPGPALRVTQGDTVDFTLVNRAPIPHSMDFHAAEIAPSRYYTNVMPGDSLHYRFVARVPGVFMYHCGTAPVAAHIANGMYGALIVDPSTPRPPADEFVLVQSEFYTAKGATPTAPLTLDWDKLLGLSPDYVVFNGRAAEYAKHPIKVKAGDLLRLYVVNAGPNRVSSFHVVGAIFERVFEDGFGRPLEGVQTVSVPVGGAAIFETRLHEPGTYPFVSHAFADATKGAVGMFEAKK
jgi:nitrite reductase (NO-forming)